MSWRWFPKKTVLAFHGEQLAEHGGPPGIRDVNLLESALARPQNLTAYGEPDHHDLAAAYAFGTARIHPFLDGNKRTAFVTGAAFLVRNGYRMTASERDAVETFLRLADGSLGEKELADWFRANSVKRPA